MARPPPARSSAYRTAAPSAVGVVLHLLLDCAACSRARCRSPQPRRTWSSQSCRPPRICSSVRSRRRSDAACRVGLLWARVATRARRCWPCTRRLEDDLLGVLIPRAMASRGVPSAWRRRSRLAARRADVEYIQRRPARSRRRTARRRHDEDSPRAMQYVSRVRGRTPSSHGIWSVAWSACGQIVTGSCDEVVQT